MLSDKQFKRLSVGLITGWLAILCLLPFCLVWFISFLKAGSSSFFVFHFTLSNYGDFFNFLYLHILWRSICFSALSVVLCLLIGYPFAYILARVAKPRRMILLLLVIIPFWTSSLIRTYAIMAIIQANGLLNKFLLLTHIIHQPLHLLYTPVASMIGLVYSLLPYMVLPIYANMEKFNWQLFDAAQDLGATRWQTFWKILVPLTVPGILGGVLLVFLPGMTIFYIQDILGGAKSMLLGNLIQDQFLVTHNWPMGATTSIVLTFMMVILLLVYARFSSVKQRSDLL